MCCPASSLPRPLEEGTVNPAFSGEEKKREAAQPWTQRVNGEPRGAMVGPGVECGLTDPRAPVYLSWREWSHNSSYFCFWKVLWPCHMAGGILDPQPGIKPTRDQSMKSFLTTGPPAKSFSRLFLNV